MLMATFIFHISSVAKTLQPCGIKDGFSASLRSLVRSRYRPQLRFASRIRATEASAVKRRQALMDLRSVYRPLQEQRETLLLLLESAEASGGNRSPQVFLGRKDDEGGVSLEGVTRIFGRRVLKFHLFFFPHPHLHPQPPPPPAFSSVLCCYVLTAASPSILHSLSIYTFAFPASLLFIFLHYSPLHPHIYIFLSLSPLSSLPLLTLHKHACNHALSLFKLITSATLYPPPRGTPTTVRPVLFLKFKQSSYVCCC